MLRTLLWKTLIKKHDQREALSTQRSCNQLLTFADRCRICDCTVSRCRQHRLQLMLNLFFCCAARHLHQLTVGPIKQEMIAQRGELQTSGLGHAMHTKEVRVLFAQPRPLGIGIHIFYHCIKLPFMRKHTIIRRSIIQVPFKTKFSRLSLASLHITTHHLFDATRHCAHNLQNNMMMVWHHLVRKDFYLRTKLLHSLLLIDESPTDSRFLHFGTNAVVDKFAKQGFSTFGNHCNMHDTRLTPSARLLPCGGFDR